MFITPIDIQSNELAEKFKESNYMVKGLTCLTLLDIMWFSRLYNVKKIFPTVTESEVKFLDEFILSCSLKHLMSDGDEIYTALIDTTKEHKLEHLLDVTTRNDDFYCYLTQFVTDQIQNNVSIAYDSKYGDFRSLHRGGYVLELDEEGNLLVDVVTDGEIDFEDATFTHLSLLGDILFVRECVWKKS